MTFNSKERPESALADQEGGALDPEKIWGGEESEWADWRSAERYMTLKEYMERQREEINSERTKMAFAAFYGATVEHPSEEMLANFFLEKGGSVFFKRRFLQHRKDVEAKTIEDYYVNRKWEHEPF